MRVCGRMRLIVCTTRARTIAQEQMGFRAYGHLHQLAWGGQERGSI